MSAIAAAGALALGVAFPGTAWGGSESPAPPPAKKHECKKPKKHHKQKCKKHEKHKCKKHGNKGATKPDEPTPVEPKPEPPQPEPTKRKAKCNAGNGNGSDDVTFVEGEHWYGGDPGKSFNAGNRGGDESPTTEPQGGVPNPGGNNHPG